MWDYNTSGFRNSRIPPFYFFCAILLSQKSEDVEDSVKEEDLKQSKNSTATIKS